jgi:predicted RNA-binding Zn-ribbon protein involved in translation (DUF1610 family)
MEKQIIDIREKNEFTDCQKCGADLRNGPVPRSEKRYYGEYAHFSELIGLRLDNYDNIITHWQCPKCGHTFPRFDTTK